MNEDTYKGESPGKKLARLVFWSEVKKSLGTRFDDVHQARIVCLASREGGDISVLKALGVPVARILGIDRCPDAIASCRQRHPDTDLRVGDVTRVLSTLPFDRTLRGPAVDAVFLDFCSPLNTETLGVASQVCSNLSPCGTVLGVGFMRGREKPTTAAMDVGGANRRLRRAALSVGGIDAGHIAILEGKSKDVREVLVPAKQLVGELAHAITLTTLLSASSSGRWPVRRGTIHYHSRSREGHGVPMCIVLFSVGSVAERAPRGDRRLSHKMERQLGLAGFREFFHRVDADEDRLRTAVLAGEHDPSPHLKLNIDPRTIAAWRAHEARGTYKVA